MNTSKPEIYSTDCFDWFKNNKDKKIHSTFFDPQYNQGKKYPNSNDKMPEKEYWNNMKNFVKNVYKITEEGGSIYFMQREKNTEHVLRVLRETGWTFKNLITWKKSTSAVPMRYCFGKQYQIIAFAIKGKKPHVFNRLRIDYPIAHNHKYERKNGIYVTDVWDDIKELTSGYFAGDEGLRDKNDKRVHEQQSPVALLLRIILSSTNPEDTFFDGMAGIGTSAVVAYQLNRNSINIELSQKYVNYIKKRTETISKADDILQYRDYYRYTENLDEIWPMTNCD